MPRNPMPRKLLQKTETALHRRGFVSADIRRLLALQILIAGTGLIFGLAALPFTSWVFSFAVGAVLSVGNFWHLARFGQAHIRREFSAAMGIKLYIGFLFRLLITGLTLFILLGPLGAPPAPPLAGLATSIVVTIVWGVARTFRKPVEGG